MDSLIGSKLAEVLNKILTGNKLVQFQAIEKIHSNLVQLVSNDVEKRKIFNKLIEVIPSIKSKNCCIALLDMLVQYSKDGHFDHINLISLLLNLINSKQENSVYSLISLTDLMLTHRETLALKYSIRNPSHPFIEILRNSNEQTDNLHQFVFQQIISIYSNKQISCEEASSLLKPVFIHIFLESSSYKHLIADFLLQKMFLEKADNPDTLSELIVIYFSHIKLDESNNINVLKSLRYIIENYQANNKIDVYFIANFLIKIDLAHSFNCSLEWNLLTALAENHPKLVTEKNLILLSSSLSKIGLNNLEAYLNFVHNCVKNYNGTSKISVAQFIPNLFEYLIAFSSLDATKEKGYKFYIIRLLSLIDDLIKSNEKKLKYESIDLTQTNLFNFIEYEKLDNLCNDPNENINREKLNTLSAHFILNDTDLEVTTKIANLFHKLNKKWPFLSVTFFTLYINKIKTSRNYTIINFLLSTFVDLIVPKIDINQFLNVFITLIDSSNTSDTLIVKQTCMLQMVRLCKMKYDHLVYPHLAKHLITGKTDKLSDVSREKTLYTKALCIQEIITYRPDYYAQELLATISNLINNCNQKNDGGICAILIDTMAILCETEVVDMISTFNALHPQFKNEKRTLALNAYCRFISTAASLDYLHKTEEQDSFYERVIKILWSMCKHNEPDFNETTSSALSALGKFNRTHFKCSYLPKTFQEIIINKNKKLVNLEANKDKSIDEIFLQVPASCYIDIFNNIYSDAYDGFKNFIQSALIEEIDSIPRRLQNNREKIYTEDDQQTIQKNFYDLIKKYLVEESKQTLSELTKSSIDDNDTSSYVLYCYEAVVNNKSSSGKYYKISSLVYWSNYETTLKSLLVKGKLKITAENLKNLTKGLYDFLQKAFNGCIQAIKSEYEKKLSENDDLTNEKCMEKKDKIQNSWIEARDKLIKILIQSHEELTNLNESIDSNIFVLILGLIVNIVSKHVKLVFSKQATDLYQKMHFNQSKWTEVLIDFLLNIKENKVTTKNEFLTTFSYNKIFQAESLKFLYEIFRETTIHFYFLAQIQRSCITLKISSYLLQYLHTSQLEIFEGYNHGAIDTTPFILEASSVYVQNLIKSRKEYDQIANKQINNLIQKIHSNITSLINSKKSTSALLNNINIMIDCLYTIYDEESVFYDDCNVLVSLVNKLNHNFKNKAYPFEKNQVNKMSIVCLINITCIAYKSNLITNENLNELYFFLIDDVKLNSLLAFYCRFLVSFGYSEALNWLESTHTKWIKTLNDFRLKLKTNKEELQFTIEGLLALTTGISLNCLVFNQIISFTAETEKILKPESTIKEIMKYIHVKATDKCLVDLQSIKNYLAYLYFNYTQFKYGTVFSMPDNFDYLDDLSILRQTFNEINRIIKNSNEPNSSLKFKFMLDVLLTSCKSSNTKSLPPVNWYFFISSLLKSKFGKDHETSIIELAMLQFNKSNSAYALIKNFLIDTNYFNILKFESQLVISQYLNTIWSKLNINLLSKYLNKLKLYLNQTENNSFYSKDKRNNLYTNIFESLVKFAQAERENTHLIYSQIIDFFTYVCSEFTFDVSDETEIKLVDKITDIVIKLDDETFMKKIIDLEKDNLNETRFLMIFYIKCHSIVNQTQSISIINESIQILVQNIDLISSKTRTKFIEIFTNCMVKSNAKIEIDNDVSKANNFKTKTLNWLIEFIGMAKDLINTNYLDTSMELLLKLFSCFIYSWSTQTYGISKDLIRIDQEQIFINLDSYMIRLFKSKFWKQCQNKLVDWLIFVLNSLIKNQSKKSFVINIKRCLTELYIIEEWPIDVWYKFAEIANKKEYLMI